MMKKFFAIVYISGWLSQIQSHVQLNMATPQPQVAFVAFNKSLQCECIYLQRGIPDCRTLLAPLQNAVY